MDAPAAGAPREIPREILREVLGKARGLGFLGPGPVEHQLAHSEGFVAALGPPPSGRVLDLGSGGGLPGLVLAREWPGTSITLLDAAARRVAFLEEAASQLGLAGRVTVVQARAEEAGRRTELRGSFDLVTARGFGAPAVTAECAAPFLRPGGALAVSEPPDAPPGRWPAELLAQLGLGPAGIRHGEAVTVAVIRQESPASDRWPRRTGIPSKRPLWR